MICAPSEDSDQPEHPPRLIRVFAVRSMGSYGPKLSSCGQRRLRSAWVDAQADLSLRLRSAWVDAQADLSLRWAHMPFCWFCHEAAHTGNGQNFSFSLLIRYEYRYFLHWYSSGENDENLQHVKINGFFFFKFDSLKSLKISLKLNYNADFTLHTLLVYNLTFLM